MNKPKVVMFGLGYIGLPTATLIASLGYEVHGVDTNPKVVESINQGRIHIIEPDLAELVAKTVSEGRLKAYPHPVEGDVFLVAVPTPFMGDHQPDVRYVEAATDAAIPFLRPGNLFIIESTSPIGTTEKMAQRIYAERPELEGKIFVAYCPERVLPGNVIHELVENDRSIGGIDTISGQRAAVFYRLFVKASLYCTTARTAEMCKLVENSYRDVNIAFANEISILADQFGVDVWELIRHANRHPRVNILSPGCGVGGHCIAVDPWFLVAAAAGEARVIRISREQNISKTHWSLNRIMKTADELTQAHGRMVKIACMGLAFKPNIDDLRESPALEIAEGLIRGGYEPLVVEPNVVSWGGGILTKTEEAVQGADLIVFLVGHAEFRELQIPAGKRVLDFCGIRNHS